jgi:hypothetical protein
MKKWLEQTMQKSPDKPASVKGKGKGKGKGKETSEEGSVSKKRRTQQSSDSTLQAAVVAIGELSLETARNERVISGALCRTFLMPPCALLEHPLEVCSTATDPLTQHQCVWAALTSALAAAPPNEAINASIAILRDHESACITDWGEAVNYCRCVYTYDGQKVKTQIWVERNLDELCKAMARILVFNGALFKWGAPPRTVKERRAQQLIQQLRSS